jgi:hypothetical protein
LIPSPLRFKQDLDIGFNDQRVGRVEIRVAMIPTERWGMTSWAETDADGVGTV